MEKYSRLTALTLAILNLIATALFGLFIILSIYPLAMLLSDTEGKVFFVGGLIFFWLTLKTVSCFHSSNQPSYNLLAGHTLIMIFGSFYFDWKFLLYIPVIIVYATPMLINKFLQKQHNKSFKPTPKSGAV